MRKLILTAVIVVILIILAVTAGSWAPRGADVVRVVLWLLAAFAGAVGVRRALEESKAKEKAVLDEAALKGGNGDGPLPDDTQSKAEWAKAAEELAEQGITSVVSEAGAEGLGPNESLVTLYTAGGVRIIAEGSCLEIEEGDLRATPPGEIPAAAAAVAAEAGSGAEPEEAEPPDDSAAQPGLTAPAAAQTPMINSPYNLPADLTDFVGRTSETARIRRGLQRKGRMSISGIAGMGGIGKTALALHVAHGMADESFFPDAQLYIDLKGTEPSPLKPAAALKTLLAALDGPDPERPDDEESLSKLWRGALDDREALLILDNARDADQVKPLMPESPTCAVLVTSRTRFRLPDAGLLDLNRLKSKDARALLQGLVERLDDASADKIARLCGGLPLALRIAGNYLAVNDEVSPEEYLAQLSDERERLRYLRDPNNPDLDVAATLSLSVAGLPDGALWAWSLLSLLPAPFDAGAASALWGEGTAEDAWVPLDDETAREWLEMLHNRSLVNFNPDTGRYHLHDLLRLAARQELGDSHDIRGARVRLLCHFVAVVQSVDEEQRYSELDPDWPSVQLALEEAQSDTETFSRMVMTLDNYWSARGMARERAEWNDQAAKACREARRRDREGIHLGNLGNAYADRGDARRAIEYYSRALGLSRRNNQQRVEGVLLGNMGQAYGAMGETRRAVQYHQQALEIARSTGDRRGEATELDNLGQSFADLGEAQRAVEHHTQALTIAEELGDQRMEGTLLSNLGLAYAALGDAQRAVECQKQALAIHRRIGDLRGEATGLDNLGRAYADLGQPERAIDYYEQALEIDQAIGDRRGEGSDLGNLGLAYADLGEYRTAIDHYEMALKIAEEVGDRRSEGNCLGALGKAHAELGDLQTAMDNYWKALRIAQQTGDRRGEATWLGSLGQAYAQLGDVDQAMDYHEQALAIYQSIGDRRSEGKHLANLGMLAKMDGDTGRAREVWTNALRTFEAMKDPTAGQVYDWLAELDAEPVPVSG